MLEVELKAAGDATLDAKIDCALDTYAILRDAALDAGYELDVLMASCSPFILHAVQARRPPDLPTVHTRLVLGLGVPHPLLDDNYPLSDLGDVSLDGVEVYPPWLTDAQLRALRSMNVEADVWFLDATPETLEGIERIDPTYVLTGQARTVRDWLDPVLRPDAHPFLTSRPCWPHAANRDNGSMSRFGVSCIAFLLGAARLAHAQPAEPGPPTPPQPSVEPPASQPAPTTPPAHEEAATPAPEPSVYDQCMAVRHRLAAEADGTDDLQEKTRLLKSMPECKPDMTAASALSAAGSGESAGADGENDGSGLAVEVRLETGLTLIGSSSALPTTEGGIFFGHRGRSATFGIGIDLGRITQSMSDPSGASASESVNTVLVMPGVRFVLARSRDEKTELLGQIDIGYGANWQSDDTGSSSPPSVGHFRAQLAPALRYWVSPSFAVGGTGGLRYDRLSQDNAGASMSIATTAMFGSFQLTGVF